MQLTYNKALKHEVKEKARVIVLSKEFKNYSREKLGAARGTVIKKTRSNPNDKYWDILFDDQAKKGIKKATIEMTFSPDLYNQNKEGGWVFESDKNALSNFKKASSFL